MPPKSGSKCTISGNGFDGIFSDLGQGITVLIFASWSLLHGRCSILETIASAGDGDDLGVVEKAVEDGGGGGHVPEQLAPFFQGAVGGHKC